MEKSKLKVASFSNAKALFSLGYIIDSAFCYCIETGELYLWIDGQIIVVSETDKDKYRYLLNVSGYEGLPVVRVGIWTKHFDNGQIAWQLDRQNGRYDCKDRKGEFPSYQKDGTVIQYQ